MIYSKFGSRLVLISKHRERSGQLSIQATAGDTPEVREYYVADIKADGGPEEIDSIIAGLPWKVLKDKKPRRSRSFHF